MTKEELDFIEALNMCDEISNEAYKKIMCHCEDAISRDKAIIQLSHLVSDWDDDWNVVIRKCIETVKTLPSVTPQPNRWIPVNERLPETYEDVLLSLRSLDVEVGFRGNTEPYYYCHGDYIEPQNVLAWQPLPEPYKAEGSGE